MKTYFSFFFISLIAALIVTPWTRNLGIRFGVLDRPNLRKIHQGEIPRLGGGGHFGCHRSALYRFFILR